MGRTKKGDPVDGVMLLDKPLGMSSNGALQKVRRLLNAQKAGHTGTLDPMATGLLPLCFGNATKFSADLLDARSEEHKSELQSLRHLVCRLLLEKIMWGAWAVLRWLLGVF